MGSHAFPALLRARLASRAPIDATPRPEARLAAVTAILRLRAETPLVPDLLFIKRADAAGDPWSGHIAFPGGRYEAGDLSLQHTALRETFEELALDIQAAGELLGRLDDLVPSSPSLPPVVIRPFVGIVTPDVTLVRSREVADVFWVPVAELRSAQSQGEHLIPVGGGTARFPAYRVGPHVIWGITERIVRQLLPLFDDLPGFQPP